MAHTPDNETWLIDAGDAVITKRAGGGRLSPGERLVYCFWVADYGMRNAGDLETARDLHREFQGEAAGLAEELLTFRTSRTDYLGISGGRRISRRRPSTCPAGAAPGAATA